MAKRNGFKCRGYWLVNYENIVDIEDDFKEVHYSQTVSGQFVQQDESWKPFSFVFLLFYTYGKGYWLPHPLIAHVPKMSEFCP